MSREEKLLSMLQPKGYVSKLKLYCYSSEFSVVKFGQLENKAYISQIKIEEL